MQKAVYLCVMKTKTEIYSAPAVQVVEWELQGGILDLSGDGVGLEGSGVDEGSALDNGNLIW